MDASDGNDPYIFGYESARSGETLLKYRGWAKRIADDPELKALFDQGRDDYFREQEESENEVRRREDSIREVRRANAERRAD